MMETNDIKWLHNFPMNAPRTQQSNVINKVLKSFEEGKKYAIIECGTGVGKSAIGFTLAKSILENCKEEINYGAYFLTTQKILQDQYEKDFSNNGLVSLYSSSNYICSRSKNKLSCKEVATDIRAESADDKYSSCKFDCVYKKKKQEFIEKSLGITNFSYFLTEKNFNNTKNALPNKKVLVIDEAHNLENELTRFIEISVSEYFSEKILKLAIDDSIKTQLQVFKFIKEQYLKKLKEKISFTEAQILKLGLSEKIDEYKSISSQLDMLKSHEIKISQFINIYDKDNWVFYLEKSDKNFRKFIFKPIDISKYANDYLFKYADYIIFMSATIINQKGFAETIGIDWEKTVCVKEKSPFPAENRPIIFYNCGSMGSKSIENTLPNMLKTIKELLEMHKSDKGIIHTHNTKIAEYICSNIKDSRLLLAYGNNRDEQLEKHIKNKKNTVLVTPSMAEGVDLKGDLSKFQVLCKMPYPYLGDKVTIKKMNKWDWWYNTQTIRTIVQSVGRSIRSESDSAITYILDNDWEKIKSRCNEYFPEGFFDTYIKY